MRAEPIIAPSLFTRHRCLRPMKKTAAKSVTGVTDGSSPRAGSLFRRLAERCNGPELLHHAQGVPSDPLFCHLPARDADYTDACRGDFLAGWRDAHQCTFMGAAGRPANRYLVAIGQHVINGEREVG